MTPCSLIKILKSQQYFIYYIVCTDTSPSIPLTIQIENYVFCIQKQTIYYSKMRSISTGHDNTKKGH